MTATAGLYGTPPSDLVEVPDDAIQFSPLMPGAATLEAQAPGSLASMIILAPPGTLERRYTLALALRVLTPGGDLTVLARNDRGGTRLRKELETFGCEPAEVARRHHRILTCVRPQTVTGIDETIAAGGPRLDETLGVWTQPGVFSWDRIDPGTALLIQHLPALSGRGADFGCGLGLLSHAVLTSPQVGELTLVDIDRRAIECAQHNTADPRARFLWADIRADDAGLTGLDFVVMNAPFHDTGSEDRGLAQSFVKRAAQVLRKSGVCWMVANRHLPYEAILAPLFKRVTLQAETAGYKIYEAQT